MCSLLHEIDFAFSETSYPGDDELTAYQVGGREYDGTWKLLRGKKWQDMPVREFISGDTPIPDLTPKALHYYLPALLKASLTPGIDAYVLDSLIFYLNPNELECGDPVWEESHRAKFDQFRSHLNKSQLQCIRMVVTEWRNRGYIDAKECQELMKAYEEKMRGSNQQSAGGNRGEATNPPSP